MKKIFRSREEQCHSAWSRVPPLRVPRFGGRWTAGEDPRSPSVCSLDLLSSFLCVLCVSVVQFSSFSLPSWGILLTQKMGIRPEQIGKRKRKRKRSRHSSYLWVTIRRQPLGRG